MGILEWHDDFMFGSPEKKEQYYSNPQMQLLQQILGMAGGMGADPNYQAGSNYFRSSIWRSRRNGAFFGSLHERVSAKNYSRLIRAICRNGRRLPIEFGFPAVAGAGWRGTPTAIGRFARTIEIWGARTGSRVCAGSRAADGASRTTRIGQIALRIQAG